MPSSSATISTMFGRRAAGLSPAWEALGIIASATAAKSFADRLSALNGMKSACRGTRGCNSAKITRLRPQGKWIFSNRRARGASQGRAAGKLRLALGSRRGLTGWALLLRLQGAGGQGGGLLGGRGQGRPAQARVRGPLPVV